MVTLDELESLVDGLIKRVAKLEAAVAKRDAAERVVPSTNTACLAGQRTIFDVDL